MCEAEPEVEVCLDLQKTFESSSTIKIIYKARREKWEVGGEGKKREMGPAWNLGNFWAMPLDMRSKRWGVKPTSLAGEMQTVNSLRNQ